MREAVGWYVRVWVGADESDDPAYETALYLSGHPTPAEAESAVKALRGKDGERIEVLDGPVIPGIGPQPERGEVTRLHGAV